MEKIFLTILIAFSVGIFLSPIIISFAKKLKANQTIYEYVDMHKAKSGTPTLGGVIFILAITISLLFVLDENSKLSLITIVVMLAYGIIGFLDDFIKIKCARNLGLRPYQKIIGQLAIAIIIGVFVYKSNLVGTKIFIPFTTNLIDIGWWIIPLTILVFIATTNSVNLTDGLDGLAGGTSLAFITSFLFVFYILLQKQNLPSNVLLFEQKNLFLVCGAGIGSLLAYLIFNCYPAKIFMGDTGSLALGGLISCLCVFSKQTLLLPILGACFVASSVSVIMQVCYYKLTKKRIFLMAPLHHHFEKKGMNETRIAVIYIIITFIIGVGSVLTTLLIN